MALGLTTIANLLRGGVPAASRMAGSAKALKLIKPSAVNVSPAAVSSLKSVGLPSAASTAATAATKGGGFNLLGGAFKAATSPVGQIGILGASLAPLAMELPYSQQRSILEAGPDSQGNFRPNIFQQAITGMDGDQFKAKYDSQQLEKLLKDPTVRERMSLGVAAPGLGDDIASYMGSTNQEFQKLLKDQKREETRQAGIDEFMNPMNQFMRGERQSQLNREHNMRVRELEAGIELAEDKIDIQRLGLMNQQNQNQYNMELAKYQAGRQADNDRYRTTAGLIKGLSALGSAFVL